MTARSATPSRRPNAVSNTANGTLQDGDQGHRHQRLDQLGHRPPSTRANDTSLRGPDGTSEAGDHDRPDRLRRHADPTTSPPRRAPTAPAPGRSAQLDLSGLSDGSISYAVKATDGPRQHGDRLQVGDQGHRHQRLDHVGHRPRLLGQQDRRPPPQGTSEAGDTIDLTVSDGTPAHDVTRLDDRHRRQLELHRGSTSPASRTARSATPSRQPTAPATAATDSQSATKDTVAPEHRDRLPGQRHHLQPDRLRLGLRQPERWTSAAPPPTAAPGTGVAFGRGRRPVRRPGLWLDDDGKLHRALAELPRRDRHQPSGSYGFAPPADGPLHGPRLARPTSPATSRRRSTSPTSTRSPSPRNTVTDVAIANVTDPVYSGQRHEARPPTARARPATRST